MPLEDNKSQSTYFAFVNNVFFLNTLFDCIQLPRNSLLPTAVYKQSGGKPTSCKFSSKTNDESAVNTNAEYQVLYRPM